MSGDIESSHNQLEQLFLACDSKGTGYIGRQEMRELCRSFDISPEDSDLIFEDLDVDGDNKISFADFCRGFRDCVNSDFAAATIKAGEGETKHKRDGKHEKSEKSDRGEKRDKKARKKVGLRRRDSMHYAFKQFSKTLGEENVLHFIGNSSQEKIHQLYQELSNSDADPHLRRQVESVLGSLLGEVRQLQEENKHMEKLYIKEKESHEERLRSMEDELEAQVARVDSQARREAEQKKEQEIKQVEMKMKEEIAELQMHLRMFQKVDDWLQKDNSRGASDEATLKRLEDATNENRGLRMNLTETETGIALMRAEMAQIRSQYEEKCRELHSERQQLEEYVARQEQIQRQLQVLQEANRRIQDTNDSLRQSLQDTTGGRPRRTHRPGSQMSSTLGDELDSLWDGESLRSFSSGRRAAHPEEVQFGIPRLMQDLDSRSLKDPDDLDSGLDRSVRDEAESSLDRSFRGDLDDLEAQQDNSIDECLMTTTDQYLELPRSVRASPAPSPRASPRVSPRAASKASPPQPASATPSAEATPQQPAVMYEATGPPDRTYKVVFAGDAAVGKSTFITRVCKGLFVTDISSTLGVDFQVKTLCVDGKNLAVQLWDTAGQERFRSITKSYFRRADGVMLLYDVTSERSFVNVRSWVQSIDEVTDTRVPIMLCGNKVDMREELLKQGQVCVSRQQGETLARDFGAHFHETSARSGAGMVEAIVELGRRMLTNEDVEVQTSALKVADDARKSGACSGSSNPSSNCKK